MRLPLLTLVCALSTLGLSACGQSAKPLAGSASLDRAQPAGRGVVDDLRTSHLRCLREHKLQVTKRGSSDLLIGTPGNQVAATFTPTPGAAQEEQLSGHVGGAEVIGSALLYPGNASDGELKSIEDCLSQGVSG